MLEILLGAGADVDARNVQARPPLECALALLDARARERLTDQELPQYGGEPCAPEPVHTEQHYARRRTAPGGRTRSPRPHRATLLIYCAANGTERTRQRTPGNIATIAQLLLERGAEVDAVSQLYDGGLTTLMLLLTSVFPGETGVTGERVHVLVQTEARVNTRADYPAMMAASARALAREGGTLLFAVGRHRSA